MRTKVRHKGRYQMQEPYAAFKHLFPDETYENGNAYLVIREGKCLECGSPFLGKPNQEFCSKRCARRNFARSYRRKA